MTRGTLVRVDLIVSKVKIVEGEKLKAFTAGTYMIYCYYKHYTNHAELE